MVIAVILAYAVYRGFILVTLGDTNVSKKSGFRNLDETGVFYPQDMGFDLAFGVGKPIDPTYGNIAAKLINFYYTNGTNSDGSQVRIKERITLDIDLCSNAGFNFTN